MNSPKHLYSQIKPLLHNYWQEISKCPCQKKKKEAHVEKLVNLELRTSTKQVKTCTRIKRA